MTRHIQAYFLTEDQAEGARMSLLPYETEFLEVSRLDRAIGRSDNLLVPLIPVNINTVNASGAYGNAVGVPAMMSMQSVLPFVAPKGRDYDNTLDGEKTRDMQDDGRGPTAFETGVVDVDSGIYDSRSLQYVLTATVKDEDYDGMVQKLRSHGAFVENIDGEK